MNVIASSPPPCRSPVHDRRIFGWRLRTAIPLPHLPAWTGDDHAPDVVIRQHFGSAGPEPEAGGLRITAPNVGVFDIHDERTVTARLAPGADPMEVAAWLQGSVLGALCHRRGLLPLHAGCVALGDRAVIIIGDSGAGKSSLTAALVTRGGRLLAEDLCPVVWPGPLSGDRFPLALPSVPRVKLDPQALAHLGLDARPEGRIPGHPEKYAVFLTAMDEPMPIAALYHINQRQVAGRARLAPLTGLAKMQAIYDGIYRRDLAVAIGRAEAAFRAAGLLASAVPAQSLWRTSEFPGIDAMASLILEDIAS